MLKDGGFAINMAEEGSARSTSAPVLSQLEAGAASTAVAAGKCARRKAAPRVHKHVASVASTARVAPASLKDAPATHALDLHIASNTAVERRSRAPWRADHRLSTQGSLSRTRRRSRRVHVWRLHQQDGEHVEDLLNARRQRVLHIHGRGGETFPGTFWPVNA